MGKGARSREINAEKAKIKREAEEKILREKKRNKLIYSAVAIVLCVCLVAGVSVKAFYFNNGAYLRNKEAVKTESLSISDNMMAYFFESTLNTYKSYYGEYFSYITGIDTSKSLKDQDYDEEQTWFDFLMSETETTLNETLALYEEGKANGFTITAEQEAMAETAANNTDLSNFSGVISKEDVKKCYEIANYAELYKQSIKDSYSISDDEIKAYFDENYKDYTTVDYRAYTIEYTGMLPEDEDVAEESDEETVEILNIDSEPVDEEAVEDAEPEITQKTLTFAEAQEYSNELSSAKGEEEFLEIAEKIQRELYEGQSDEDVASAMEATLQTGVTYVEGNTASEWEFNKDTKIGDTTVDMSGDENEGSFTVFCLVNPAEKDTSKTVNVRHILVTESTYGSAGAANAKAEEILTEWKNGEATEESFAALASKYTEDNGSAYNGGLYENVKEGDMVETFNNWIFNEERKAGDTDIVSTDYGFHVMYFVGAGDEKWAADCRSTITDEKYSEYLTGIEESHSIEYNEENISKIPG
ncbi:MAG: peptidylprolyl isomerase [Clostridia bacterium]|nr:peptidylprolyl isomerase [Clostridia bacterium]